MLTATSTTDSQITVDDLNAHLTWLLREVNRHLDLHPDSKLAAAWLIESVRVRQTLDGAVFSPNESPEEWLGHLVSMTIKVAQKARDPESAVRMVINRLALRTGVGLVVDHGGDAHLLEDAQRHLQAAVALMNEHHRISEEDIPF